MKKMFFASALLAFSSIATAGTGLNCTDENVLSDPNYLDVCVTQVDSELNGTFKELQARHKDVKEKMAALKQMQLGWIKMRDAQCDFQSMNSAGGGGVAQTAMRCIVEMTIQRDKELQDL
ncbi:lysozyme inhibitor LprI family protein [Thiothrix lacustris]|uniref:Lysozyme inhibitor LprI family protein n=1 Tax=Thiothrix lacustris TaxID=525917 RepID=A0ABY9MM76_9GAMM|nr:lysozyme inhibitor LprI family protein [Thiothrix lacustris]WML89726.1 lysozyme inhibitor LprI family protein [Thiothrix lacustris]WMP18674.1 lysozyme inhibitor LprI family protein [Thiothrix lacustris]